MNIADIFTVDGPLATYAWTNKSAFTSILSSTSLGATVGDNGGGNTNDPAFTTGVPYTFTLSVAHRLPSEVDISTIVFGSTLSNGYVMQTVTDTNYAYTNFDLFAMRPASSSTTFQQLNVKSFKVEKMNILPARPQFTSIKKQAGSAILTWSCQPGYTYTVLKTNILSGPYTNWPVLVSGYPLGFATGSSISYTDAAASTAPAYYLIQSP